MIAQANTIGSGLVLGLFLLVLINKNHKKALMRSFVKNWLNLAWPGSLRSCQYQCLHLGQEIHSRQIIINPLGTQLK